MGNECPKCNFDCDAFIHGRQQAKIVHKVEDFTAKQKVNSFKIMREVFMRNKYERIGLIVILGFFLIPQFLLGQVTNTKYDKGSIDAVFLGFGGGVAVFWLGFLLGQFFDMLSRQSLARRQKTINPKGWRTHLQSIRIILHFLGAIIVGFGFASFINRDEGFLRTDKITIGIGLIITAAAAFCGLFPDYEMTSKKLVKRLLGRN